jgi:hypothetical protein
VRKHHKVRSDMVAIAEKSADLRPFLICQAAFSIAADGCASPNSSNLRRPNAPSIQFVSNGRIVTGIDKKRFLREYRRDGPRVPELLLSRAVFRCPA